MDNYPRFCRSHEFLRLILQYKENKDVMVFKKSKQFSFNHKDFNVGYSTQKDYEFGKMLYDEEFNWKLIATSSKFKANVFVSRKNYLPDVKLFGQEFYKFDMIIPHSLEKCVYATGSSSYFKNPNIVDYNVKYKTVDNEKSISKSTCDIQVTLKSPFPMKTKRKFYQNYTQTFDEEKGECILISKPHTKVAFMEEIDKLDISKTFTTEVKGKHKNVYLHMFYSFYKLKRIDDNRTSYSFIAFISKEGWKSKLSLNDKIIGPEILKLFTSDINRLLSNVPKDFSLSKNDSNDEFLQLLIDNKTQAKIDQFNTNEKIRIQNRILSGKSNDQLNVTE